MQGQSGRPDHGVKVGQAGGGGPIVAGQLMHAAELVQGPRLAEPVAEVMEQVQGLLLAGLCFAVVLAAIGWGIYSIVNQS